MMKYVNTNYSTPIYTMFSTNQNLKKSDPSHRRTPPENAIDVGLGLALTAGYPVTFLRKLGSKLLSVSGALDLKKHSGC